MYFFYFFYFFFFFFALKTSNRRGRRGVLKVPPFWSHLFEARGKRPCRRKSREWHLSFLLQVNWQDNYQTEARVESGQLGAGACLQLYFKMEVEMGSSTRFEVQFITLPAVFVCLQMRNRRVSFHGNLDSDQLFLFTYLCVWLCVCVCHCPSPVTSPVSCTVMWWDDMFQQTRSE